MLSLFTKKLAKFWHINTSLGGRVTENYKDFVDDNDEIQEDDLFSKHTLVYMTKPENRKPTQDDVLEKNLSSYFEKNGLEDDDLFESIFDECRSVCANCAYYDAQINLDKMKEPWNQYKHTVRGSNYGRCNSTPPTVVSIKKDGKDAFKTINPITYPASFCSMFLHKANDKRNVRF